MRFKKRNRWYFRFHSEQLRLCWQTELRDMLRDLMTRQIDMKEMNYDLS
jgi:hypothetical protein